MISLTNFPGFADDVSVDKKLVGYTVDAIKGTVVCGSYSQNLKLTEGPIPKEVS
jgi:hypothetical protein